MKIQMMKNKRKCVQIFIITAIIVMCVSNVYAEPIFPFRFGFEVEPAENPGEVASSIQILLILTVLALAPSILIMMTSFTRITIVLSFLRNALGTQQMPPNQILIGLALFLTIFIMAPVGKELNEQSLQPYIREEITQQEALDRSSLTIKRFMLKQMRNEDDLAFFTSLAKITPNEGESTINPETLPLTVVIPAFIISELKIAFEMGFLIYIPFLVIDMVVSSTLMSMGMMMLPPIMISLPFKILLFIMVDGWRLVTSSIVGSFTT